MNFATALSTAIFGNAKLPSPAGADFRPLLKPAAANLNAALGAGGPPGGVERDRA